MPFGFCENSSNFSESNYSAGVRLDIIDRYRLPSIVLAHAAKSSRYHFSTYSTPLNRVHYVYMRVPEAYHFSTH